MVAKVIGKLIICNSISRLQIPPEIGTKINKYSNTYDLKMNFEIACIWF